MITNHLVVRFCGIGYYTSSTQSWEDPPYTCMQFANQNLGKKYQVLLSTKCDDNTSVLIAYDGDIPTIKDFKAYMVGTDIPNMEYELVPNANHVGMNM